MAALIPVATDCRYQTRGSNEGVIDRAKNTRAKNNPTGCSDRQYRSAGEPGQDERTAANRCVITVE